MPRRTLAVVVLLTVLVAGCGDGTLPPGSPTAPSAPATSSGPALLTVPDVVGKNAAVALEALHDVGFTDVVLGTVDWHPIVVLPQNWTVKTQSAAPGDRLAPDAKIVLGCVRNG